MEIERKWLVTEELILPQLKNGKRITQHYLTGQYDEWVIRTRRYSVESDWTRKKEDVFYLTLKGKGLLSRPELEYQITEDEYFETIKHATKLIGKIRYTIPVEGRDDLKYEIDVYDHYNFLTCEVEFKSEKEAKEFQSPDWCWLEVTDNTTYQNINLARKIGEK